MKSPAERISAILDENPHVFGQVLNMLSNRFDAAKETAAKENDQDLASFIEIAFPSLVFWKPRNKKEASLRKMALCNAAAARVYRRKAYWSDYWSKMTREAWAAFVIEFPDWERLAGV